MIKMYSNSRNGKRRFYRIINFCISIQLLYRQWTLFSPLTTHKFTKYILKYHWNMIDFVDQRGSGWVLLGLSRSKKLNTNSQQLGEAYLYAFYPWNSEAWDPRSCQTISLCLVPVLFIKKLILNLSFFSISKSLITKYWKSETFVGVSSFSCLGSKTKINRLSVDS